jgi:hypothetical protein
MTAIPPAQLRVRPATVPKRPADVELELTRAYVPMFRWPSLPVLTQHRQRINLIERFALQAATQLGSVTASELTDLTALPQRAIGPLLRRLVLAGALELYAADPDWYAPAEEAYRILADDEGTVDVLAETVRDFVYLPESDDLFVLTDATARWRADLFSRKLRPVMQMPVEPPLSDWLPSQVVNWHLTANPAHWGSADLVGALERPDEEPVGDLCPVFEAGPVLCRGNRISFTFRGPARSGRKVDAELPARGELAGPWRRLAAMAQEPDVLLLLWQAAAGPDNPLDPAELKKITIEELRSPRYAMWLPEAAVLKLRQRTLHQRPVPLSEEIGLRIEDDQAAVIIRLEPRPAEDDDAAAVLFAIDEAALLLRSDQGPSMGFRAAIDTAARHFDLPPDSDLTPDTDQVRERMWQLQYYEALYALREGDDFRYK